ncbi:hypothetical protein ACPA9J_26335 [Pseudomonas aeruginosa]
MTLGLDQNRLAMLLAVLHRHGGIPTYDQDVFLNVVGWGQGAGNRLRPGVDGGGDVQPAQPPAAARPAGVRRGRAVRRVRPVPSGQERLKSRQAWFQACHRTPHAPKEAPAGLQVIAVTRLEQALDALFR